MFGPGLYLGEMKYVPFGLVFACVCLSVSTSLKMIHGFVEAPDRQVTQETKNSCGAVQ